MERQENEFNLTIGGEIEQIDVKVLTSALTSLDEIVDRVNAGLKTNSNVSLTVKTYKPGSFDIYLQVLADATAIAAASGLFNTHHLEMAKQIIDAVTSLFSLKKALRGQQPKEVKVIEGDNFEITGNTGNVLVIKELHLELAKDSKIDQSISELFASVNEIPYANGLRIRDHKENEVFSASKKENDFNNMITPISLNEEPPEIETRERNFPNAVLNCFKIVFGKTEQWKFIYEGNKISVSLKDNEFIQEVIDGRRDFANGDQVVCDLTVQQVFDKGLNTFINKKYIVTKVKEVIKRPRQSSI